MLVNSPTITKTKKEFSLDELKNELKILLKEAESEERITSSKFYPFPKSMVINAVMDRLESFQEKEDSFGYLCIILLRYLGPDKEEDINRIAKILGWEKFRENHQTFSWKTRDVLMTIINRVPGSEADTDVDDFKRYCEESGKEFPEIKVKKDPLSREVSYPFKNPYL